MAIKPDETPQTADILLDKEENTLPEGSSEGTSTAMNKTDEKMPKSPSIEEKTPSADESEFADQDGHDNDDEHRYRWCKFPLTAEEAPHYPNDHYFFHRDGGGSVWEEPSEPYWIWDRETNEIHKCGLQQPSKEATSAAQTPDATSADPNYWGYNPKIHGDYDPNAPYAQYHKQKREQERAAEEAAESAKHAFAHGYGGGGVPTTSGQPQQDAEAYAATASFNRFTGKYQADKDAEHYNEYNRSGRQLNGFYDVDAAANVHDGRSLKAERRQHKPTKAEVQEYNRKRREKKEKKRRDFYNS